MNSDVGQRIAIVRKDLGLGVLEFSRKAQVSNSIIYEAEAGTKEVGLSALARLSRTYGISLNWLVFGLGPMYLKDTQLPFRGDALDVIGKNFPVTDAPGLVEFLEDRDLFNRLKLTLDELQSFAKHVKDFPEVARFHSKDTWIELTYKMRRARLDAVAGLMEEMKKKGES